MGLKKFERIGECGVDSGSLMIIDPCYAKHFSGMLDIHKLLQNFQQGKLDANTMASEMLKTIDFNNEYTFRKGIVRKSDGRKLGCFDKIDGKIITWSTPLDEFNGKCMNELRNEKGWEEFLDSDYSIGDFNFGGACHTHNNKRFQLGMYMGVVFGTKYGDGIYEVKGRRDSDGDICEVKIKLA